MTKVYMWGQVCDQTDNEVAHELAELYRVENRRLRDENEALRQFVQHDMGCQTWQGYTPCDCGLLELLQ